MTETDAAKEIVKRHFLAEERFCPLIKDKCRLDCVCFAPAKAAESPKGSNKWGVEYGYCDNTMFDGTRVG